MRHATFHVGGKTIHASIDGDKIYSAIPLTTDELNEIRRTDATLTATQALETVHAHPPKWRKRWRQEHAGTAQGGIPREVRPVVDNKPGSQAEVPKEAATRSDSLFRGQESETQEVTGWAKDKPTIEPGDTYTIQPDAPRETPRKPWFGR